MSGLCVADNRCVDFDRRRDEPRLAEQGPLCEGCLVAGERAVTALVLDFRDLEQHLPPSLGQWSDGQPAARDEHRVPLNLAVDELQRQIWWVLTTWEEVVRDLDRLSESVTRGVRAGWAVQAAAQILRPRVRLLAQVGAVELAGYPVLGEDEAHRRGSIEWAELPGWRGVLDVAWLHRRAQRLLGLTSPLPERCEGVPCRECDTMALVREPGEDSVRCGACRAVYTKDEYQRWTGLKAAEQARPKESAA